MDLPARRKKQLPATLAKKITPRVVYEAFLRQRNANTRRAYKHDLEAFSDYCGAESPLEAFVELIALELGQANLVAFGWVQTMAEAKLAPSTINRRLSSLRSIVRLASTLGAVTWELKVQSIPSKKYRDTSGPGTANVKRLLAHTESKADCPKGRRDLAIVRLLFGHALRRSEVTKLNMDDVDFDRKRLRILGKGRTEHEFITLSKSALRAISSYVDLHRRHDKGPLFISLDPAGKGREGRLDGSSIHMIVKKLGRQIGIEVWPHALRHSGITAALDATDGDVRRVQRFSRHKKLDTLMIYDDNREDLAGEVAELLDEHMEDNEEEAPSEEEDA